MSDPFSNFKFEWRTDAQNNEAIWFLNPWTNGWEELAMIKWCCHPPEKLQEVDAFFEALQSSWVNALQLTESNRQLREELERVKAGFPNIGNDPLKVRDSGSVVEAAMERIGTACAIQQIGVPDQTALVWRIDLSRVRSEVIWRSTHLPIIKKQDAKITTLTTALAAAKEALEQLWKLGNEPFPASSKGNRMAENALARIAECEK